MKKYLKMDKRYYGYKFNNMFHGITYVDTPWVVRYKGEIFFDFGYNELHL